jgi:uncharacterized protein YbjT (DUF2867 family)
MSQPEIKNVALAGATGALGTHVYNALVANGKFNLTVLTRDASKANFPAEVTVKEVDYDSVDSLAAALAGIDALVNANNQVDLEVSKRVVDAAIVAGVRRYVPPDFGSDPNSTLLPTLPVFRTKYLTHKYLAEKAAAGDITYTIVSNGPFLDWCLTTGFMAIDLQARKIGLFDGGENVHPWTLLSDIATATANVLLHLAETENRVAYVHSINKSQKQVAELAKEALGGEWEESEINVTKLYEQSMESIKAGIINFGVLVPLIQYNISRPEGSTVIENDDSALLGLKELSDDGIKELIKKLAAAGPGSA